MPEMLEHARALMPWVAGIGFFVPMLLMLFAGAWDATGDAGPRAGSGEGRDG